MGKYVHFGLWLRPRDNARMMTFWRRTRHRLARMLGPYVRQGRGYDALSKREQRKIGDVRTSQKFVKGAWG
jgi:hypothetical protein